MEPGRGSTIERGVEYDRVPGAFAAVAGVLGVIGGVLMLLTDDAVAVEAR